nr:macrophage mannose receptor 1-like [Misgurnus anguillicaudatus]
MESLLFFTGLCLFTQMSWCDYLVVEETKTWYEAQAYCRQNHIDLATVQSNEDWTNVQEADNTVFTSVAWTGLYNDVTAWRWSYQNENMTFVIWQSGQPNNKFSHQECISFESNTWNDRDCQETYQFFCFNVNGMGSNRYVWIRNWMNWSDAQSYCRQHYTDLATIRSQTENDYLVQMTAGQGIVWIGLFRDWWEWSDGTNFNNTAMNWMTGQPDIDGRNSPCGAVNHDGLMYDQLCTDAFPFICRIRAKRQVVKVEVKSGLNPNDPAVMEIILQWIKQKLRDQRIEKDTRLRWRVQPDGNVFSLKHH